MNRIESPQVRRVAAFLNLSPVNQSLTNHRVLCVLVDPDDLPDAVRARLRQEDIDLDHRPDVFRGLARVGQWQPGVVILGADWLTADELGFFDQVRRAAPMARLFIFGDERRAGLAYLALAAMRDVQPIGLEALHDALRAKMRRSGVTKAHGPATTEKIPDFDPDSVAPPADVLNASIETGREPSEVDDSIDQYGEPFVVPADPFDGLEDEVFADDALADDVFAEGVFADDDELDDDGPEFGEGYEDDELFADDETDDDAQPVRVPWLRYDERPKRIPPSKASPPRAEPDNATGGSNRTGGGVNGHDDADDDPPLLSTEELEALLGEGPIE